MVAANLLFSHLLQCYTMQYKVKLVTNPTQVLRQLVAILNYFDIFEQWSIIYTYLYTSY